MTPIGSTSWYQGDVSIFTSQAGPADSYIAANFNNAAAGGTIADWLISRGGSVRCRRVDSRAMRIAMGWLCTVTPSVVGAAERRLQQDVGAPGAIWTAAGATPPTQRAG